MKKVLTSWSKPRGAAVNILSQQGIGRPWPHRLYLNVLRQPDSVRICASTCHATFSHASRGGTSASPTLHQAWSVWER